MDTLETCPFCGADNLEMVQDRFGRHVECLTCWAIGPNRANEESAAEAWNHRAEQEVEKNGRN